MFTAPMEPTPEIIAREIEPFREVAICGKVYRDIIKEEGLTLAEIAQHPIVSFGKKTSTYDFYFRLFEKHGLDFAPDIEAATADQIIPLVRHNLGIGFVPERFLDERGEEGIYRVPLADEIPVRQILLAKKRSHALALPAKKLEKMILGEE